MKITKIDLPEKKEYDDGLGTITMERLGSIVLLAGRNGSGKTRLLKRIKFYTQIRPSDHEIDRLKQNLIAYENNISNNPNHSDLISWKNEVKNIQIRLDPLNYIEFNEHKEEYKVIDFVPKSLELTDSNELSKNLLQSNAGSITKPGIDNLSNGAFARIQFEQDKYYNVTHQLSETDENEKSQIVNTYRALEKLIFDFLGCKLTRSSDGTAEIFKLPLGKTELSDGQKVLLQLCLALHAQGTSLDDVILIMDEPENHLHPAALIEVISKIKDQIKDSQLWIATHSITLLSQLDTSSIWYMENNKITYAGKQPERVLKGLLGDDDQISKLSDFLSLPAQFASNQFAYECLFNPQAVQTGKDDAQTNQIRKYLTSNEIGSSLKVLDYGAGKGRLADAINYSDEIPDKLSLRKWFNYVAFDKYNDDKEHCMAAISRIYDTTEKHYYNDESILLGEHDNKSFDVVVLCNVLHEIDPRHWLTTFSSTNMIASCLKEDGVLLIVEDQLIPVGEKAYKNGFLVLSLPQIKALFKITESDTDFKALDARDDHRLMAYKIPKYCLTRICNDSRIEALENLEAQTKREIKNLREGDANYKKGKLHGFWIQQLANSILCLEEFK